MSDAQATGSRPVNRLRPQRIAHVLPWKGVGGVEMATLRLAQAVEGQEFTSVAFYLHGAEPVKALFERAGIPVLGYDAPEPSVRRGLTYVARSLALARQFRRADISVVHCADLLAAYRCSFAAWLAGVPVISHVRGQFPLIPRRDRGFLWPVRKFIFVSRDTRRVFGFRVADSRSGILHDGIETSSQSAHVEGVRRELGVAPTTRIIGMVARVAPAKDFATLIRAAEVVVRSHPDVLFLIVGENRGIRDYSEHFELVRKLIIEANLERFFRFTGHRDDVARLIGAMDIGVLSTFGEGLPLAMLEAMAQGKPYVATNVGGIPEVIEHGRTGFLVPLGDAEALATTLISLLDDRSYAAAIGEAAQAHVQGEFGIASFRERALAVYRDVVAD